MCKLMYSYQVNDIEGLTYAAQNGRRFDDDSEGTRTYPTMWPSSPIAITKTLPFPWVILAILNVPSNDMLDPGWREQRRACMCGDTCGKISVRTCMQRDGCIQARSSAQASKPLRAVLVKQHHLTRLSVELKAADEHGVDCSKTPAARAHRTSDN